jgi:hypothetical protein
MLQTPFYQHTVEEVLRTVLGDAAEKLPYKTKLRELSLCNSWKILFVNISIKLL